MFCSEIFLITEIFFFTEIFSDAARPEPAHQQLPHDSERDVLAVSPALRTLSSSGHQLTTSGIVLVLGLVVLRLRG